MGLTRAFRLDRGEKAKQSVEIANVGDVDSLARALRQVVLQSQEAATIAGEPIPTKSEIIAKVRQAATINHINPEELLKLMELA